MILAIHANEVRPLVDIQSLYAAGACAGGGNAPIVANTCFAAAAAARGFLSVPTATIRDANGNVIWSKPIEELKGVGLRSAAVVGCSGQTVSFVTAKVRSDVGPAFQNTNYLLMVTVDLEDDYVHVENIEPLEGNSVRAVAVLDDCHIVYTPLVEVGMISSRIRKETITGPSLFVKKICNRRHGNYRRTDDEAEAEDRGKSKSRKSPQYDSPAMEKRLNFGVPALIC